MRPWICRLVDQTKNKENENNKNETGKQQQQSGNDKTKEVINNRG